MSYTLEDFIYIDSHCHFFPPQIFKSIWNFFEVPDEEGNQRGWNIKYRLTTDALVKFLKNHRVEYEIFPILSNPIYDNTNNCPNSADNNTVKFKKRNKD